VSLRDEWAFRYQGSSIRDAAAEKGRYHREREKSWREEQDLAEATLKEKGFVVEEYAVTGGFQAQAKIDPTLQTRYTDCYQKRMEHKRKAEEYDGWAKVMGVSPNATFELHHDDVLYFGLGRETE
jgi:hypothetical protein